MIKKPYSRASRPEGPEVSFEPLSLDEAAIRFAVRGAVASFWRTLESQASLAGAGDRGNRAGVTGGKQMDALAGLLVRTALGVGAPPEAIRVHSRLELPGYFRPEKRWDFIVIHKGSLIASAELKSQVGPSFGNNYNNRAEEAIGSGLDLVRAMERRPNPNGKPVWRGWLMLLEDATKSKLKVSLSEPNYQVDAEFRDTSYSDRYGLLCDRLVAEGLYSATALILAPRGRVGDFAEPVSSHGVVNLLRSLARACASGMK